MNKFNDFILDISNKIQNLEKEKNCKRSLKDRYIEIEDDDDFDMSYNKKIKAEEKTDTTNNIQFLLRDNHNNNTYNTYNTYNTLEYYNQKNQH